MLRKRRFWGGEDIGGGEWGKFRGIEVKLADGRNCVGRRGDIESGRWMGSILWRTICLWR